MKETWNFKRALTKNICYTLPILDIKGSESLKQRKKFWWKYFFPIMLNEVLKICEKCKNLYKQQQIKDLVTVSYKFL